MSILNQYEPKNVWKYFEEICAIPHGSGHLEQIGDYLINFAKEQGLEWSRDAMGNVIIIKEASAGYEDVEPLILQGHMDMVCEKTPESDIDFRTDGLKLQVADGFVTADGTTLGADDGIAVAYGLAFLSDSELPHPRLEVVLTVDEEIGLLGAAGIDLSALKGKKLINLDSEEEGVFLSGCAGGLTLEAAVPLSEEEVEGTALTLDFGGFKGGHSGNDIDKGRANSNQIAARVLYGISKNRDFAVSAFSGGTKDNAIPRQTIVRVIAPNGSEEAFEEDLRKLEKEIQAEYASKDPDIRIIIKKERNARENALTKESASRLYNVLMNVPCGIQAMSGEVAGLVETSLSLGVAFIEKEALTLRFSVRSSRESAKRYLRDRTILFLEREGGICTVNGDYPGWTYQKESPLRDSLAESYERLFGSKPRMEAIHAGVECGILLEKLRGADCVSLGPQMYEIHTTGERLNIASVERYYRLLRDVIMKK